MNLQKGTQTHPEPTTYKKWRKQRGKIEELGLKSFITDKMYLQAQGTVEKAIEGVASMMAKEMTKAMMFHGQEIPKKLYHDRERDPSLRLWEYVFVSEAPLVCLPEQFLYRAAREWSALFTFLQYWENASLGEFLWYWITRTWQSIKKKIKINQYEEDDY